MVWSVSIKAPDGARAHLPTWAFNGVVQYGGFAQRGSDGRLFVPFLGSKSIESPHSAFATKRRAPAFLAEVSASGELVGTTSLKNVSGNPNAGIDSFESAIAFTPGGCPFFSGYRSSDATWQLLILSHNDTSNAVFIGESDVGLSIPAASSKSKPNQLIAAIPGAVEVFDVAEDGCNVVHRWTSNVTSTVLFNFDGTQAVNNHLRNNSQGAQGLYTIKLPIKDNSKHVLLVKDCVTAPWLMVTDSQNRWFMHCGRPFSGPGDLGAWDSKGTFLWKINSTQYDNIFMDDEEKVLVGATGTTLDAFDPNTGAVKWQASLRMDNFSAGVTRCRTSPTPFSLRIPLVVGQKLVLQCDLDGVSALLVLDLETGRVLTPPLALDLEPMELLSDASGTLYALAENPSTGHIKLNAIVMRALMSQ